MKKGVKESFSFERIIRDIKSVKIQGAENIARAGIKAYALQPDKKSIKKILSARPTEPLLQNAIYLLRKSKNKEKVARKFLNELKKAHETIVIKGAALIKNNMNIYVHCHSSSVIDILKYAKKKRKKNFVVYTTEVEPLLQGRMTAKDLSKAGIKVFLSPDLNAEAALVKCDLFLFGADAFTRKYIVNKIGTSNLVDLAKFHKIPRYSCGVSLKFTKKVKLEMRPSREVWNQYNKNIEIINPSFDKTKIKLLSGIISELGILSPKQFVKEAKENLKQILNTQTS
ncbi:MAG: hypothetical protein NUV97_02590 [archaeon]|nr:hypothetical protein [archaeon]MCR4323967.1 hypothetical protein [Nanoarchaeota archaeon]